MAYIFNLSFHWATAGGCGFNYDVVVGFLAIKNNILSWNWLSFVGLDNLEQTQSNFICLSSAVFSGKTQKNVQSSFFCQHCGSCKY